MRPAGIILQHEATTEATAPTLRREAITPHHAETAHREAIARRAAILHPVVTVHRAAVAAVHMARRAAVRTAAVAVADLTAVEGIPAVISNFNFSFTRLFLHNGPEQSGPLYVKKKEAE